MLRGEHISVLRYMYSAYLFISVNCKTKNSSTININARRFLIYIETACESSKKYVL
jgi:hypothetical protein